MRAAKRSFEDRRSQTGVWERAMVEARVMAINQWIQVQLLPSRNWTCGHCGLTVAGNLGFYKNITLPQGGAALQPQQMGPNIPQIFICPGCEKPTYFEGNTQMPAVAF